LQDFPAALHVHISSVDAYDQLDAPEKTAEDAAINIAANSNYGAHKILAEQIVRHYAADWLILRLAGMVGPALRKNPVFDLLNGQPLRIHPDSRYQFMHTAEVARILWELVQSPARKEIYNVCGDGLISPREIAALAGKPMDLSLLPANAAPRIVDINIQKLKKFTRVETSANAMARFLRETKAAPVAV
jgi:nucleoside-diphosphate-sugar epimerase